MREILAAGAECTCAVPAESSPPWRRRSFRASISNVGAYALVAGLPLVLDRTEFAPRPSLVSSLLERGLEYGLIEGVTLDRGFAGDDGVPDAAVSAVVSCSHNRQPRVRANSPAFGTPFFRGLVESVRLAPGRDCPPQPSINVAVGAY